MNPWSRWVAAIASMESATSLALFRIGIGLGTMVTLGSVVWRGLVPVLWFDVADGGYRSLGEGPWLVEWLGGPSPLVVWGVVVGGWIGGLALLLGVGGRPAALATLLCTSAAVNLNGHSGGSYDELLTNGLWLTVLAGGQATLSVTARLETGAWWPYVPVLAFPRWLAMWQLCLMYGATGLQKVSAFWVPGGDASALYYILQQPEWHRRDMSFLAWVFPLTQIATTSTWFWEVLSPLWILALWWSADPSRPGRVRAWSNRLGVRWWFFGFGVMVHAGIWATMEVGPFSLLSLAFYPVAVHPAEWERWLRAPRSPPPPA